MREHPWVALIFFTTSLLAGFWFWWQADWWAYAHTGEGLVPKFKLTLLEQVVISAVVGVFWGVGLNRVSVDGV
jgi:hypothetical protein